MLLGRNIEIWRANLDIDPDIESQYWSVLNPAEKERANRFVKKQDQTRFIAGRGILRHLLGQYLDLSPQAIQFDYLPRGKPVLASDHSCPNLQFNVSHSHHLALYAFTDSGDGIGIDVECLRSLPQALSLAKRFFTKNEVSYLASLPSQQQEAMFFQFWTAKEASLKATGEGLVGLQSIEIAVSAKNPNQFEVITGNPRMQLSCFMPEKNVVAAVASLGNNDDLNPGQQIDQATDTSNQWTVADRGLDAESLEKRLVFRNWDE